MATIEEIRVSAYYIWEAKGRPSGSCLQDWLEAEQLAGMAVSTLEAVMEAVAMAPRGKPAAAKAAVAEAVAPPAAKPGPPVKAAPRSRKKAAAS
jgi:hypothetical protein